MTSTGALSAEMTLALTWLSKSGRVSTEHSAKIRKLSSFDGTPQATF